MAVNDEIFKNLAQYGGGTINERVYNFLGSLGYTGTISDRLGQFEEGGRKGWQGLIRAWGQYTPAQVFSQGQQGVWYEPKPIVAGQQVLYQNIAGTAPVTADGDPVGLMLDLSRGLVLGPERFSGDFSEFSQTEDGWTIAPDKLSCDGVDSSEFASANLFADVVGYHEIEFTIANHESGQLAISVTDGTEDTQRFSGNGTFKVRAYDYNDSGVKFFFKSIFFNGEITQLSVKEVLGNHATQGTSAARPTYPGLEYDGVDNFLRSSDFGLAQPYTVSVAFYPTIDDDFFWDGLSINSGSLYVMSDGSDRLRAFAGATLLSSQAVTYNEWNIATVIFDGVNSEIRLNTVPNSGNVGTSDPGGVTIGVGGDQTTRPFAGSVSDAVVSAGRWGSDKINRVEEYLAKSVGVTL